MRVIVRLFFKRSFSNIKNNFKDISSKRPFKILKNFLKNKKLNQILLFTIQNYFPSYKSPFDGYNPNGLRSIFSHRLKQRVSARYESGQKPGTFMSFHNFAVYIIEVSGISMFCLCVCEGLVRLLSAIHHGGR